MGSEDGGERGAAPAFCGVIESWTGREKMTHFVAVGGWGVKNARGKTKKEKITYPCVRGSAFPNFTRGRKIKGKVLFGPSWLSFGLRLDNGGLGRWTGY